MDPLRDRIFGLLTDLCGEQAELSPDSLRLLSHTLLGVARDNAPTALFAVRDALPWVTALIEGSDGADPETLAQMLVSRGVVRALDTRFLATRLDAVRRGLDSGGVTNGASLETRLTRAFRDLALLDRRLVDLSMRSDASIRNGLFEDPQLLAAAASVARSGEQPEIARRFRESLDLDTDEHDLALLLLADLETTFDGGAVKARTGFGERTRRFELSACDHLRESGFAPAVRAALLYGGHGLTENDARRRLQGYDVFTADGPLTDLAIALIEQRGNVAAHVAGREPLGCFQSWVEYLRGPCHEIAEARDIAMREATSFAHFCLHVVNFCDLAAGSEASAHDDARRAIMTVEDELKEFALEAQSEGLRDDEVRLAVWAVARLEDVPAEERVLERIARLAGAWRTGLTRDESGRVRLDADALDPWFEAFGTVQPDAGTIREVAGKLPTITFRETTLLGALEPSDALRLFLFAVGAANRGEVVDFAPLSGWLIAGRRPLLDGMLDVLDLVEPTPGRCGIVTMRTATGVRVDVRRHEEFEALLVLLRADSVPESMRKIARRRVRQLTEPERPISPVPGAWVNA